MFKIFYYRTHLISDHIYVKFVSVEEELKLNEEKEVQKSPVPSNIISTVSSPISNRKNRKLLSNEGKHVIIINILIISFAPI